VDFDVEAFSVVPIDVGDATIFVMRVGGHAVTWHEGPPVGGGYWRAGDVVYNATPADDEPAGWICKVENCRAPGDWRPFDPPLGLP
jgi:hypothetical protein